ncbi:MAG: TonB-dependent receptor [Cereibacter sp.]|jgi:hemoglobin/transferrin/lactoferrin receptor protein|nr:TonB-dependent receptor [Cereibacter sp.]
MSTGLLPAPRARLFLSTAAILVCAGPAAAQEGEGPITLLARLIFGTGTERVAIDTPQAVTVLEQEDLDREQPLTIGDLFASVPGVQAAGASARIAGQAFNIRGIGNTEQTASEARIAVTVDGAPKFFEQYRMGSFFGDLELFKRVEVLRGPASSTLYGSGAIGGAVNFTTKGASDFLAPSKTTALRFKTGYDSNGNGKRAGVIYATRPTENAEFLGALNWSTGRDQQDGDGTDIAGTAYDRWSGLAKGSFSFGDEGEQSLSLSVSRSDSDLDDTIVAQTGGAAAAGFGTADLHTLDDTLTLTYRHGFAANPLLDVTATAFWTDTEVKKDDFSFGFLCAPGQTQVLCESDFAYRTKGVKIENTSDLSSGVWENYVTTGLQLSEQERVATSSQGALAFHPEGTDRRLGLYAQGEFTWNDRLTLIPGLRIDMGDITPSDAAAAAGGRDQSETSVSPKLAAMYRIDDSWSIFGSLARTERMPTLDELYSTEGPASRGPGLIAVPRTASLDLEKEEAETIELGFTFQRDGLISGDDSLKLKATAFRNDVTNLIATTDRPIVPVGAPGSVAYYSNVDEADIWGAELEAAYDAEAWFAQLAYSNVHSRDGETGLTLADTPAENVAITLGRKLPARNLTLAWRASYFDAITTSSAATSAGSYDTHDVFLTWTPEDGALGGFSLNAGIDNLFDATYRNNLVQDNATGRSFHISMAKTLDW